MIEDDNDWMPDEADSVDIESLPLASNFKARKPAEENMYEPKAGTFSLGLSDGSNRNDDEVSNANKPNYGNNKFGKTKYPQKKVYKKPEPRDFDENPVDEEERTRLLKRAEMTAVWHLARRDMTEKQVKEKLVKKGIFPPDVIQEMINKCIENNWLNDERYAENFTRSKQEYQKLGKNAIRMELIKKGIDSETASDAVSQINTEEERERAVALVQSKLYSTRNLDKQKRINRLLGLLARKGYSANIAYDVIREVLDAEIIDDDLTI